jgi:hypothetical protein
VRKKGQDEKKGKIGGWEQKKKGKKQTAKTKEKKDKKKWG